MEQVYARVLASTNESLPTLDVYPGSIKRPCFGCEADVWVGPRQQEVLEGSTPVVVACMGCAIKAAAEAQETMTVAQLGNPYRSTVSGGRDTGHTVG
jgi:hypothetical protein